MPSVPGPNRNVRLSVDFPLSPIRRGTPASCAISPLLLWKLFDPELPFVVRSAKSDWTVQRHLSEVARPRNQIKNPPKAPADGRSFLAKMGD